MAPDSRIPFSALGARLRPPAIMALMSAAFDNPRLLSLAAGFTDTDSLPVRAVGAAVEALAAADGPPEHLQYGTNIGRPALRGLLAGRTAASDGLAPDVLAHAHTVIGNGSQQLLYLALQVVCDPGDIVLVEEPSYFVLLEMLAGMGVRALALPAAADGTIDVAATRARLDDLSRTGEHTRVKAVYVMGWFANPSGRSRTETEKSALAATLREAGLIVPVIEDAAYRDLWFETPWPARSVLALEAWRDFPRLYCGTLTKPFASGLKVGYAHGTDPEWLERMLWLKGHHDFGTGNFNQAVLETVLARGGLETHLAELRPRYAAKMRRLDGALRDGGLSDLGWSWTRPAGGLYLWLQAPVGLDTGAEGALWRAALAEEVIYVPGELCVSTPVAGRGRDHVRLSFGVLDGAPLEEAARRFIRAAQRVAPVSVGRG